MIEKVMYKVKDNNFRVQDFTKRDNVDESKFIEGTNQRGAPQLQAQVCVLYHDEYEDINQKLASHESEVQHLKAMIEERESEIIKLKKQVKEKSSANIDEVNQLKQDKSTMKEDFDKQVQHLHQEMTKLEKSHLEDIDKLKETHTNQLLAIHEKHNKEIERMQTQFNAKLDEINDKLLCEVQGNKETNNKLRDEITTLRNDYQKEIDTLHQEKSNLEMTHANETLELTKAHQSEVMQLSEDISQLKQEHLKEINDKDKLHNDNVEQIRTSFLKLVTLDHSEDMSELSEIKKSVPSLLKPFMRKHIKQIEDMQERKQANKPEKIIKTYELSGEKEKE